MKNLPKLSSILQDIQIPSQSSKNQPEAIQQIESRKITTALSGRNLSPFTWNNIKLPSVLIQQKSQKKPQIYLKDTQQQPPIQKLAKKNQLIQPKKLQTISQKAKKRLNIYVELQKSLLQKVSPFKSLQEKVLLQSEKSKIKAGLKLRQNRSFTQKQDKRLLARTYETIEKKGGDKNDLMQASNQLLRTEQRYRDSKSNRYPNKIKKTDEIQQNERYAGKGNPQKIGRAQSRAKYKNLNGSQDQKYLLNGLNNSIVVKSARHSVSKDFNSHSINQQQMQPYLRRYFAKLADQKGPLKLKIFVTTNPKYHPLHRKQHNISASDNNHPSTQKILIWTKLQSLNIFRQKSPEQYYNHVEGSHVLTSKQKLHQILNGGKGNTKIFYPITFSFPKEYNEFIQEYDWVLVKVCLKFIVHQINKFQRGIVVQNSQANQQENSLKSQHFHNPAVCISDILEDLTRETKNDSQLKLLKFCLFLESGRKKEKLQIFFQRLQSYRPVQINLSQNIYIDVIDWCLQLTKLGQQNLQQNKQAQIMLANSLGLQNVDYRLIQLLKSFDYLFSNYLPPYLYRTLSPQNSWVIKPFASSKAAGISLVINSSQFYTTPDYEYKQYRHRSKYHNKIFMKYIQNPFLIKYSGMDYFFQKNIKEIKKQLEKTQNCQDQCENILTQMNQKVQRFLNLEQKFCGRKFDIRQWVLIFCDQKHDTNSQNHDKIINNTFYEGRKSPKNPKNLKKTKIYKYHTAYCRFAQKKYSLNVNDPQIHLTNYEIYKKSSLKNDKKSPSISIQQKKFNTSILQKSEHFESMTEEMKRKIFQPSVKTKKRIGSMVKQQKDSVMMLDELFEYINFITKIKENKISLNASDKGKGQVFWIKKKYESQLDMIINSLFEASFRHLTHHRGTFELFGLDLLMDEEKNLYLLQVNLNPGCSSQRQQKLNKQAEMMLQKMFETVIGNVDEKESKDLKANIIQNMNHKLIGSRQFISDSELQNDAFSQNYRIEEGQQINQCKKEPNISGQDQKWILVAEKLTS